MDKLLTKKDVAEILQVTPQTVDEYIKKGIITRVRKLDCIRFSQQHIAEIIDTKLERFSPIERRRLERENEILRIENEKLNEVLSNVLAETSKIINLKEGEHENRSRI